MTIMELAATPPAVTAGGPIEADWGNIVAAALAEHELRLNAMLPPGSMWAFAGIAAPPGWAICDGSDHLSTDPTWAALFAVIGYRYGQVGAANFKLPDMRGRTAVGAQPGDGLLGDVGRSVGSRNTLLVTHAHGQDSHQHGVGIGNHQHYIEHMHDLQNHQHLDSSRQGYNMNIASRAGRTNAIWVDNGQPVDFITRESAIMQSQVPGGATDWVGVPNVNNTGWMMQRSWSDGAGAANYGTDWRQPAIYNAGSGNGIDANLQPSLTINYLIRL